jgi:hypothetical protein
LRGFDIREHGELSVIMSSSRVRLAGTLSNRGQFGGHAASWFSAHQVIVGLIFIAVFVLLLAGPLLLEPLNDLFSKGVEKAAPGGFVLGLAVLLIGIFSGVKVLEIAGGSLVGAVVLGVIVDNYLTAVNTSPRTPAPTARGRPMRARRRCVR